MLLLTCCCFYQLWSIAVVLHQTLKLFVKNLSSLCSIFHIQWVKTPQLPRRYWHLLHHNDKIDFLKFFETQMFQYGSIFPSAEQQFLTDRKVPLWLNHSPVMIRLTSKGSSCSLSPQLSHLTGWKGNEHVRGGSGQRALSTWLHYFLNTALTLRSHQPSWPYDSLKHLATWQLVSSHSPVQCGHALPAGGGQLCKLQPVLRPKGSWCWFQYWLNSWRLKTPENGSIPKYS